MVDSDSPPGPVPSRGPPEPALELAALIADAPIGVAVFQGPQHRLIFVNRMGAIFGRGRARSGAAFVETFPEPCGHSVATTLDRVYRTGEPAELHEQPYRALGVDGAPEERWLAINVQPVRGSDGRVSGVIAFGFDVTEHVRMRRDLERARAETQRANRAKDEFLAMLGHELRNPLAPMLTALQLMRLRGGDSREQQVLERQVAHLTRLVDDLLDTSRITGGKIVLRKRVVELAPVVARALELASPLLEQRHQRLEMQVSTADLTIEADPDRLAQVIANLLTNAAKYSEAGRRILLVAEREGERVRLRVRDEGVGIAPDMLESIFHLFVQQPQSLDRQQGGLGLGLAIARSLVKMHGGTLVAKSDGLGRGSEFIMELPARSAVATAPEAPDGMGCAGRAPAPLLAPSESGRILLVDDNEDALMTLKYGLEELGHLVAVARDGPAALERAGIFHPRIALLDLGLPVMDGYELAERLRALPGLDAVHLVAVTGYGQDTDRARTIAAGFERHLVKPVALEDIDRVVRELTAH
jgi:signal transduction histidine kinase/CheY-like chemotaxis protein